MQADEMKASVRQFFEAMEQGTIEEAASFWAPNAINHGAGRPGQQPPGGPGAILALFGSLRTAFPDRRFHIEDLIVEGDKVVCRMMVSGTYGDIPPIPVEGAMLIASAPTGTPYSVQQIHIVRLADSKIVEHWAARDDLGLLLQLGVIRQPERAASTT